MQKTKRNKHFVGLKIKDAREELAKTQAEFAEELGITREYLSALENDKKPVSYMLAKKLTRITNKPLENWKGE